MDTTESFIQNVDFISERLSSLCGTSTTNHREFHEGLRALVVDDSISCRLITSLLLRKYDYEVTSVGGGFEALKMLREKPCHFDLVISDVHMPKMDGFQLLQCILQEFATLPVFLMSGDNEREMVTRGILNGAAFYLTKPLTYSDIEKLWQHVFTRKMETKNIKQTEGREQDWLQQEKQKISSFYQKQKISCIDGSSSKANEEEHRPDSLRCQNRKISNIGVSSSKANDQETLLKTHELSNTKESVHDPLSDDERSGLPQISKNGKGVVWKGTLQNLFLQAVEYLGVKHAEPKKIQEHMNVPGLTRKNIASHLQKHRFKDRAQKRTEPSTSAPLNVKPQNPQETFQYPLSSFQLESRDGNFQGFNAPSSIFPTNNNQRLMVPAHQPWLAHNISTDNEQSINMQNIAAISHCNTTICSDEFMSELNFNVSEYLVDGDTDDSDIV